jgi:type IV secretory pathway TrbL component
MGIAAGLIGGGASLLGARSQRKAAKRAGEDIAQASQAAQSAEERMYQQSRDDMMPWLTAGRSGLEELMQMAGMERYETPGAANPDFAEYQQLQAQMNELQRTGNPRNLRYAGQMAALTDRMAALNPSPTMPSQVGYRRSANPSALLDRLALDPGYALRKREGMTSLENSALARGGLLSGNFLKNAQRYGQDLASQEYGNAFNRLAGIAGVGQTQAQQMAGLGSQFAGNTGQNLMNAANARASGYAGKANATTDMLGNLTNLAMMGYGMGMFGKKPAIKPTT